MAYVMNEKVLLGKTAEHIHWLSERTGIHHDMHQAWLTMKKAAQLDGLDIMIASGYRSFERQLAIWNNKYSGQISVKDIDNKIINLETLSNNAKIEAILLFSALPGASRHHWGTDIDIYAKNLLLENQTLQLEPWEYQQNGPFYPLSLWLNEHSKKYGFYFPYDKFRGGIAAEPWHLSYAPLSNQFQQQFTPALLAEALQESEILGKMTLIKNLSTIYTKFISNIGEFPRG